jgi:hypothetical protein
MLYPEGAYHVCLQNVLGLSPLVRLLTLQEIVLQMFRDRIRE